MSEIADAVVYLENASFVTGAILQSTAARVPVTEPEAVKKTFLITGVSGGTRPYLRKKAQAVGFLVVGTCLQTDQTEFEALSLPTTRACCWASPTTPPVNTQVARVEEDMGPINVLISNASYGLESTAKESSMNDLHRQLDVNFFGRAEAAERRLRHSSSRPAGLHRLSCRTLTHLRHA